VSPDDIIKLLDELGQRLEGPTKHLFELAYRQTLIEGVIFSVLVLIAFAINVVGSIAWIKHGTNENDPPMWAQAFGYGMLLAIPAMLIFGLPALTNLLNPEWVAVGKLIDMIPKP
jgi:hypothetical protein